VVTHQLQVERRTGKVRRPETDVLPLSHATNPIHGTKDKSPVSEGEEHHVKNEDETDESHKSQLKF